MTNFEMTKTHTHENFTKVVRLGTKAKRNGRAYSVYCEINYKDGNLSIAGVEGPLPNGNAIGCCGQLHRELKDFNAFANGWNQGKVNRFVSVWRKWHLNDMIAGSPAQMEYLESRRATNALEHAVICEELEANDLQPDMHYFHDGKPYRYGTAWLKKEVPDDVIDFLKALPITDQHPAWI